MRWPGHRFALALFAGVLLAWMAGMLLMLRWASLPPEAAGTMLVVFEPGITEDQAFAAIIKAHGKPVRKSALDFIWVVTSDEAGLAKRLADVGALGSYRELPFSPEFVGCVAVADRKIKSLFRP